MGKYITLPQDKYPKPTQEEVLKAVAEMSYQSPIEVATRELQTKFEDDAMSVIHSYGICVDKEELVKALQYDRNQYKQGFADGCRVKMNKIRAEVVNEICEELEERVAMTEFIVESAKPLTAWDVMYFAKDIVHSRIAELKMKYTEADENGI